MIIQGTVSRMPTWGRGGSPFSWSLWPLPCDWSRVTWPREVGASMHLYSVATAQTSLFYLNTWTYSRGNSGGLLLRIRTPLKCKAHKGREFCFVPLCVLGTHSSAWPEAGSQYVCEDWVNDSSRTSITVLLKHLAGWSGTDPWLDPWQTLVKRGPAVPNLDATITTRLCGGHELITPRVSK